jgi:hypothetical protein
MSPKYDSLIIQQVLVYLATSIDISIKSFLDFNLLYLDHN